MVNNNFNGNNMNWQESGHGLYIIESTGYCFSHSNKQFNNKWRCFEFDEGDIILIEYDPIENKLSFMKSFLTKFEMPIIPPP